MRTIAQGQTQYLMQWFSHLKQDLSSIVSHAHLCSVFKMILGICALAQQPRLRQTKGQMPKQEFYENQN